MQSHTAESAAMESVLLARLWPVQKLGSWIMQIME